MVVAESIVLFNFRNNVRTKYFGLIFENEQPKLETEKKTQKVPFEFKPTDLGYWMYLYLQQPRTTAISMFRDYNRILFITVYLIHAFQD